MGISGDAPWETHPRRTSPGLVMPFVDHKAPEGKDNERHSDVTCLSGHIPGIGT